MSHRSEDEAEVVVLAPIGRDAELIRALLKKHGLPSRGVATAQALADDIERGGIGAAIVTEEALSPQALEVLAQVLKRQAPWSDFPLVVMSAHGVVGGMRRVEGLSALGNVTMLDRPVQTRTLLSAVQACLRARQRQYAARRAIAERDRFLAMLGHELRNPLGAILFATEKLTRGAEERRSNKHVDMVHRQARLLAKLVDDLLDVSRVTSGKIVLSKHQVDLRELANRSLATVEAWVTARQMNVVKHLDPQPVWVEGDMVRLEQVVTNLLVNALKYTPERGCIEVRVSTEGNESVLSVRDTGIGITAEALDRIFDLFAQLENTLDRSQGGLGLGLTLVRSLVELHGGRVEAKSAGPGKGSEFLVRLPSSKQPERVERVTTTVAKGPYRVVVVEDNRDIREMLEELLVEEGHAVSAAAEGSSGLNLIVKERPDLALVDIGLPGLDGYQVAEEVRRQMGQRVRMVALSGYGQPEDKARALRAGFDAHLTKPIDIDSLHAAMAG